MLHIHMESLPVMPPLERLRSQLPEKIKLTYGPCPPAPAEFSVLISGFPTAADLDASAHLHTLIIPWAGLPHRTRKLLLDRPKLKVHNIHHNAYAVAETALTLLLTVAKHTLSCDRQMRSNNWSPRFHNPNDALLLAGKQALVLGYGAIGKRLALMCQAMGMHVKAIRRQGPSPSPDQLQKTPRNLFTDQAPAEIEVYGQQALPQLLASTHALLVCLPGTPATHNMIDAKTLMKLPTDAVLVNVGRASVIDEQALYQALDNHSLFGAGLDVWYQYPTTPEHPIAAPSRFPFASLDNVVMSPHRADKCRDNEEMRVDALVPLLKAIADQQDLPNVVDVALGY